MDFLNKAKAKLADIEGDLTKATQSLGIGDKKGGQASAAAPPPSQEQPRDTMASPQSTTMNTPSTSVAPSVAGDAPKAKLPLAIRKAVRDEYEVKIPELEAELSKVCGAPWKLHIDPGWVYSFATDSYAKQSPGKMITKYVEQATRRINDYVEKFGENGRIELNNLASQHALTLEPATTQKFSYCGCEVSGGCLRLLFQKNMLGTNIDDAARELSQAVNAAGASAPGASVLDFNAKHSIMTELEPKIEAVRAGLAQDLGVPTLTLYPNYEENYVLLDRYVKGEKVGSMWPREWQKRYGRDTLAYFEAIRRNVERLGFAKDDMLREGFQDAVDKNEIHLKVVEKLEKGNYNESVIRNGVLYVQTTPPMWTTNISESAQNLMDLL